MPQLVITEQAASGLERCRQFLLAESSLAAEAAARIISASLKRLESNPHLGRPLPEAPDIRELVIPFG